LTGYRQSFLLHFVSKLQRCTGLTQDLDHVMIGCMYNDGCIVLLAAHQ
jgi:hypothetical protein